MSQIFSALHLLDFHSDRPPAIASDAQLRLAQVADREQNISALKDWIAKAVKLIEQEREGRLAAEERARRAEAESRRQMPRIQKLERQLVLLRSK